MRFVRRKSCARLALQAVLRARPRLVSDRTRPVNRIRGLPAEHGSATARGTPRRRATLAQTVDGDRAGRGDPIPELLREAREALVDLDRRGASCGRRRLETLIRSDGMCLRIGRIEGLGPVTVTVTAPVAAAGDRTCFGNGREFAARPGLVPRPGSSDGRTRLPGTSERGDRYVRTATIHGRAVHAKPGGRRDPRSRWIGRMRERRHTNVVAVAPADENAGIVRSVPSRGEACGPVRIAAPSRSRR